MPHDERPNPNVPPRENRSDVEKTINPENEVDEAAFESFPASDPPGVMGQRVGPADLPHPEEDEPSDEDGPADEEEG